MQELRQIEAKLALIWEAVTNEADPTEKRKGQAQLSIWRSKVDKKRVEVTRECQQAVNQSLQRYRETNDPKHAVTILGGTHTT